MILNPNLKSQKKNKADESKQEIKKHAQENSAVLDFLLCFIDDICHHLPRTCYSCASQARDKQTVKTRFANEGLSFATKALPLLSEGLFLYLETGKVSYPSFMLKGDTGHPVFLSGLFRLAYSVTSYQVTAVRLIYQISVAFSKLRGPYPESVLRKQHSDFVATDRALADIDWFSDVNFPILQQARLEITKLFENSDINLRAKPRPGPGATNTPVAKHNRYSPKVLYTQVNDVVDYIEFFNVNSYDAIHQTKFWLNLEKTKVKEPRSRYTTVPKKAGKGRGICIEENEVQFLQQAYRSALYEYVEHHPSTSGRVNFSKQDYNALLALIGSWTGLLATLDLSEASDRNARELASWVFQDTDFHDALMALSTRWIDFPDLPGLESIRTFKFAPMGSALCFPIMALLYWALIRSIIHLSALNNNLKKDVYVYGDDIVIPLPAVEAVLTYLPRFGMKVNQNKSFYRSGFRESCGLHAFNGVNITPVYIKYIPTNESISQIVSCLAVESQLFSANYPSVSRLFRSRIVSFTGALPFVSENSSLFGFKRAGVFVPYGVGVPRTKIDQWGNPLYKFRVVVAKGTESFAPPSEGECYLRHCLTSSAVKEIGGRPDEFKTVWRYLRTSQITGCTLVEIPGLQNTNYKDEARADADVSKESLYEINSKEYRKGSAFDEKGTSHVNYSLWFVPMLGSAGKFAAPPVYRPFPSYIGPGRIPPFRCVADPNKRTKQVSLRLP